MQSITHRALIDQLITSHLNNAIDDMGDDGVPAGADALTNAFELVETAISEMHHGLCPIHELLVNVTSEDDALMSMIGDDVPDGVPAEHHEQWSRCMEAVADTIYTPVIRPRREGE